MNDYPMINQTESSLVVEFAPNPQHVKCQALEMVLDYGDSGEVIGVEILKSSL
jgi:hypothetical protein